MRKPTRRGPDGTHDGIDLAQALDEISARLSEVIAQYGPDSVALYHGTGVKMNSLGLMALKSWLGDLGSPYLYSSSTIDQSAKWVTAARMGYMPTGRQPLADSEVLMLVGANPVVSHTQMFVLPFTHPLRSIRELRKEGRKLIVVDPRRTETARHADIHVQVKPGQDPAFFAGLIRLILERDWQDAAFCERYVYDVDALRRAVAPFTLELVEARTGIDGATVEEVARVFSLSGSGSAVTGTGPSMSAYSNLSEHLVETLNALCGRYRREGDRIRNPGAFQPASSTIAAQAVAPNRTWESGPKLRTADVGMLGGEYPTSQLPAEIHGSASGRIRALFVIGGDLVSALADPRSTLAAFERLDLLVTVDPVFSSTAAVSDFYVPTTLPFERPDVTVAVDAMFEEPFVQVSQPLLDPPDSVIEDWEFFWELARRSGRPLTLRPTRIGQAASRQRGIALSQAAKPTTADVIRAVCEEAGLDYDELASHPSGVRVPREPVRVVAPDTDNGARLHTIPDDVADELRRFLGEVEDRQRPLLLTNRRMLEVMNSALHDLPRVRRKFPTNPLYMNPHDMHDLSLSEGDRVLIESEHGSVEAVCRAEEGLRREVVSMAHQWGDPLDDGTASTAGSLTGRLTSTTDNLESINFMPRQSAIPVAVTAVAH